jgi:hypothetical protein
MLLQAPSAVVSVAYIQAKVLSVYKVRSRNKTCVMRALLLATAAIFSVLIGATVKNAANVCFTSYHHVFWQKCEFKATFDI